jgi:hypothetical protein
VPSPSKAIPRERGGEHGVLVEVCGEAQHDVQAGGGAVDGHLRQPRGERGEQGVALTSVEPPPAAQVTVEVAALDQISQGELL